MYHKETIKAQASKFKMELNNKFSILAHRVAEDIDSHCSQITSAIKESSLVINNPNQLKQTLLN